MSVIIEVEQSAIVVDEAMYNMVLENVELVESKFSGGAIKWTWSGFHDELGEFNLTGMSSARITPATKAGKWYTALNKGKQPKVGEKIDLSQFIGCVAVVQVRNKTTADGMTYSNIVEVVKLEDDSDSFIAQKRVTEAPAAQESDDDVSVPF